MSCGVLRACALTIKWTVMARIENIDSKHSELCVQSEGEMKTNLIYLEKLISGLKHLFVSLVNLCIANVGTLLSIGQGSFVWFGE